ncbi:MAG: class I SAM-dependent methyltransferase [Xanthobacteraceae bacterium]
MPDIEWNKRRWGEEHSWSEHGDEWSYFFGSAAAHWYAFILPRLYRFLPKPAATDSRIVEIAPGHGRWTQFLLTHCGTLVGYDVSANCIDYCRRRFAADVDRGAAEFHVTDGLTLSEDDDSVDLVFSFDSLVHVERDVMKSYLAQIARCLKPGAFAFLQHSNLGSYPELCNYNNQGPFNCRGASVSAGTVRTDAKECGLDAVLQEGLNHETQAMRNELADCITLIQKPARAHEPRKTLVVSNRHYPTIGELTRAYALPYETCEVS